MFLDYYCSWFIVSKILGGGVRFLLKKFLCILKGEGKFSLTVFANTQPPFPRFLNGYVDHDSLRAPQNANNHYAY